MRRTLTPSAFARARCSVELKTLQRSLPFAARYAAFGLLSITHYQVADVYCSTQERCSFRRYNCGGCGGAHPEAVNNENRKVKVPLDVTENVSPHGGASSSTSVAAPSAQADDPLGLRHFVYEHHALVSEVSRLMPEEVLEEICESHGGIVAYCRARPLLFRVRQRRNTVSWEVCKLTGHQHVSGGRAKGRVDVALKKRPRMLLPPGPVQLRSLLGDNRSDHDTHGMESNAGLIASLIDILETLLVPDVQAMVVAEPPCGLASPAADLGGLWVLPAPGFDTLAALSQATAAVTAPPAPFDVCRLARVLSANAFTPMSALSAIQDTLLTTSITSIALGAPERFETRLEPLVEEAHLPVPLRRFAGLPSYVRECIRCISALRYQCSSEALLNRSRFESADTVEVLQQQMQELKRQRKEGTVHFMRSRDRLAALKQRIWWREHPKGHPLLEVDVLGYAIYDVIAEKGESMREADLRERLMALYPDLPVFRSRLLKEMGSLFQATEVSAGNYVLSLADSPASVAAADQASRSSQLSKAAVIACVLAATPKRSPRNTCVLPSTASDSPPTAPEDEPFHVYASSVRLNLTKLEIAAVFHHFGSIEALFDTFPETFQRMENGRFAVTERRLAELGAASHADSATHPQRPAQPTA